MRNDFEARQSRKTFDAMLKKVKRIHQLRQPRVWMRDVREALGMNAKQFARRLGVSQPAIAALEKSEQMGTIKIGTLRKAAEALECRLIYALVPKTSLEDIVHSRKCRIAEQELLAATPDFGRLPVLAQAISIDNAARRIPALRVWEEKGDAPSCMSGPDEIKKALQSDIEAMRKLLMKEAGMRDVPESARAAEPPPDGTQPAGAWRKLFATKPKWWEE